MKKVILMVSVVVIVVVAGHYGCQMMNMAKHQGAQAVAVMSAREQAFLTEKLARITAQTTYEQIQTVLGTPYRGANTTRPVWLGTDKSKNSQISIYFSDGRPFRIRWIKLGQFMWEKNV